MTRINTNVSSLVAQKQLARSNTQLQTSLTRLSTGLRINVGKDDPAGLIASEILRSDIVATQRAITNSERANQIIATADSALGQVSALLNDIRGLVSEAANTGALSDEQIQANQLQVDSSLEAIDRIAQTTSFQGRRLLDGSLDFLTTNPDNALLRASGTVGTAVDVASTGVFTGGAADAFAGATVNALGPGIVQFSASSAGPGLNNVNVIFQATNVATVASFANNTLTIKASATATALDIASAVNASGGIEFKASVNAAGAVFSTTVSAGETFTSTTSGGNFAHQIHLSSTAGGTRFNANVNVTVGASNNVAYNTANTTLTIIRSANATASEIASAITAHGVFQASVSGNGAGIISAVAFNSATTGGLNGNNIILSATVGGTAYNGATVDVVTTDIAATAAYNTGTNTLTISRSALATVAELITAVNTNGVFSASTNSNGYGILSGTFLGATSGGSTGAASLSDLKIEQANFGTASSINVQVEIDTQATQATLIYSGGTLSSDLVLQIGGKNGFDTLNFGSGTTVEKIASAINQISDAIGVSASVTSSATSGSVLRLESVEYGSDAFVSARPLNSATFAVSDFAGTSTDRTTGTDVELRINGVQATGKGLRASINTSTLDLNFQVNDQLQDGDDFDFSITGGGANFQIGPDVVSNQQARLGIQGLSTATLGGVSGKLYELRSGGAKDLKTDTKGAAKVVDEVITSVTGIRGRLGAFQRTTLETNIFTLNDVLENLTDAESQIRDADFAAESARLTRAQILVQSGTSVLAIANQNPQNVLALLR
ncbi:MAG: flagellin [Pirellulales bacterium]